MDEADISAGSREQQQLRLRQLADSMAATLGTPDADALDRTARDLARKYGLPDSSSLAAAFAEGLGKAMVLDGRLVLAQIGRTAAFFGLEQWAARGIAIGQVATLASILQEHGPWLREASTARLVDALNDFLTDHGVNDWLIPNVGPDGKGRSKPLPVCAFVRVLEDEWREQTGDLTAYKDPATHEGRGDFWFFAKEACRACGLKSPSIQTLERWFREGYPMHWQSAVTLWGNTSPGDENS